MVSDIPLEQFLANNGWTFAHVDSPDELRAGDLILVLDGEQDGSFCCATVLRATGSAS